MAQMILGTVGQAIGGPVGAVIGASLGRVVDQGVISALEPARQRGPRLETLKVNLPGRPLPEGEGEKTGAAANEPKAAGEGKQAPNKGAAPPMLNVEE